MFSFSTIFFLTFGSDALSAAAPPDNAMSEKNDTNALAVVCSTEMKREQKEIKTSIAKGM